METPGSLQRSIATAEELHSIVRTMKTLSSTMIREYERASDTMRDYVRTVELGFRVLLKDVTMPARAQVSETGGSIGLVAVGSDRGFCGPFNRDIARHLADWWRAAPDEAAPDEAAPDKRAARRVMCLGIRLGAELELRGEGPEVVARMPGSVAGIVASVQDLVWRLDAWRDDGVERVVLFHHRPIESGHEPVVTQLLPLDEQRLRSLAQRPWPTKVIPRSLMDPGVLIATLTRELVFASLYRIHAESLASEHAARLAAMRSAEQTIEERLEDLGQRYNEVRQAVMTEELLDVTSGFEALSEDER